MVDIRLYMERESTICGHGKLWVVNFGDGPITIGCTKCLPLEEIFARVEVLLFQWFAEHDIEENVLDFPYSDPPSRAAPDRN